MKNVAAKTRPVERPYASWTHPNTGWRYRLLKSWQGDNNQPYSRWFMRVDGWSTDLGDVYVEEMFSGIKRATDLTFDTTIWPDRAAFLKWVGEGI